MSRKKYFGVFSALLGITYLMIGHAIDIVFESPLDWVIFIAICFAAGVAADFLLKHEKENGKN